MPAAAALTGNTGTPNICSYRASVGTTSVPYWANSPPAPNAGAGYAGCGPDPFRLNNPPGTPGCQPYSTGLFCYWFSYGISDCTDGTSNTVAFSESLVGDSTNSVRRPNNSVLNVGAIQAAEAQDVSALPLSTVQAALNACSQAYAAAGAGNITNSNGTRWGWGAVGITMFHTIVPPNSKQWAWNSCRDNCQWCSSDDSTFSNAQSNHSGGVNVLFADGSVKFVKDSISMPTWFSLGTKTGGEVISSDSY